MTNRKGQKLKLSETEKWYAKCAIRACDGDREASSILRRDIELGLVPEEIIRYYGLKMCLSITYGSDEHKELFRLGAKYETDEVLATNLW